jgi:hypothetical protein
MSDKQEHARDWIDWFKTDPRDIDWGPEMNSVVHKTFGPFRNQNYMGLSTDLISMIGAFMKLFDPDEFPFEDYIKFCAEWAAASELEDRRTNKN